MLAQVPPASACGTREGQGRLVPVAVPAAGLVGKRGEVVEASRWPQLTGGVVAHQLDLDAEFLLHGHVGTQRSVVRSAHADQVAGPCVPRRRTEDLGRVLEDGQGVPGHGGQGGDAVVAAHDAAGLAAPPEADGGALEHEHIGRATLDEGPCG